MDRHRHSASAHPESLAGSLAVLDRGFAAEKHFPVFELGRLAANRELLLQTDHCLAQDCGGPKSIESPRRRDFGRYFARVTFLAGLCFIQGNDYLPATPLKSLAFPPLIGQ